MRQSTSCGGALRGSARVRAALLHSGRPRSLATACPKNRYVIKVEPHRAILEPDYFIKMIEAAETSRDEEIEKVELGLKDPNADLEGEEKPEVDEWKNLQDSSNEEYLMRTVLPVLYQGMKVVDQQRPVAPLEYLALYLLKHQAQVKLPPKPAAR